MAANLGIGKLLLKDESAIGGLDSFKIRGVSYAVSRLLEQGRIQKNSVLTCATDGNHGRAVARVARELKMKAHIFVPQYTVPVRIASIRKEGAQITIVSGGYDEAVKEAAKVAISTNSNLISDFSWPGYEEVPVHIMAGYTSILDECAQQWGNCIPQAVFVQTGVGGLAYAVLDWLCRRFGDKRPYLISCEPLAAPCLFESFRTGQRASVECQDTLMAGLNCGEVSFIAFPFLIGHTDAFLRIPDEYACQTVCQLARPSNGDDAVLSGASGACGLASLQAVLGLEEFKPLRELLQLGRSSTVLVFNTEGATDPELHDRLLAGTADKEGTLAKSIRS